MGSDGLNTAEINSKVSQYWSVIVTEECTSTQSELAENFAPGKVLVAEFQSAGRGRLDRKFEVPARKGLTFSFAFDSPIWQENVGWIPLVTGLAIAKAINQEIKRDLVKVKWPNDLLIDGSKLGGILSERLDGGFIVGAGINILQSEPELPIPNATSLTMHAEVDRLQLLIAILQELGKAFRESAFQTKDSILKWKNEYRNSCVTLGKIVKVTLPNGESFEDTALAISEDGSLLLKTREIRVGDIVHLR